MNLLSKTELTLLKPSVSKKEIIDFCKTAITHKVSTVCVNPYNVKLAKEQLKGSGIRVCTGIGFPLGATFREVKVLETNLAIENGADDIDIMLNIGALKNKDYDYILKEIHDVKEICQKHNKCLKVILEMCYLTEEEKRKACLLAVEAGADYVKTSTGFGPGGAEAADVQLMKETVGDQAKIKAAGGIRDRKKAEAMIEAGANRIGTSTVIR